MPRVVRTAEEQLAYEARQRERRREYNRRRRAGDTRCEVRARDAERKRKARRDEACRRSENAAKRRRYHAAKIEKIKATMSGHRNMAARPGVISSRNVAIPVIKAAVTTANKAVKCGQSMPRATQTPRTSLRSAACQTDIITYPGLQSASSHGATPNSSSTCQDASVGNWPGVKVDLLQTGVCCVACCKLFAREDSADRHWRLHHEATKQAALQVEPYWCPYCPFSSYIRKCVQAHERSHREEEAYTCQLFPPEHQSKNKPSQDKTSRAVRVSGRRSRNGKTAHICHVCQKVFALRQSLVVHVRRHTGERPFECDVCRKCFRRKDALTVHQRAHEKHHACPLCGQRFARRRELDAHDTVHTMHLRGHPHVCGVCRESFVCRERLILHENSAHARAVERPYECITCHESFPHKMALIRHDCKLIQSRMVEVAVQKATALGMS
ncbi:uncharacterized protein LOC144142406 [Haemaphysalis longicornis]